MLGYQGVTGATEVPRLLEKAKLSFVRGLRIAFSSSLAHADLRYNEDQASSKIRIYTAHPLTMEFTPCLVVSCTGGDASIGYLQDDFVGEDVDNSRLQFAGRMMFNISLTVYTQSTLEREKLMDHLIFFCRHLFRGTFHGFNIEYTRDISIGSENLIEVDNKPVYEQTMNIPCYMEYVSYIDQSAFNTVREILVGIDVGTEVVTK